MFLIRRVLVFRCLFGSSSLRRRVDHAEKGMIGSVWTGSCNHHRCVVYQRRKSVSDHVNDDDDEEVYTMYRSK